MDSPPASKIIPELRKPILEGVETRRLLDSGFQTWGDLYTDRQADVLLSALRRIDSMPASEACKDRLAMAVIGIAEMPAFLSRWDRYHLKVFEGLANHRYADTTVVVEMNPLSSLGRGTLPHRLDSAKEALEWILKEAGPTIKTTRRRRMTRRLELKKGVTIATGCSSHQWLFNKTVDLVLTDPPYYDDVQYGELARLFHFWLSLYRGDRMPDFNETEEAVPNSSRGHGLEFYVKSISACLKESKRTLVPGGKLILTFHNKKMVAWHALCCVLIRSGFALRAIAVVRAENKADHSKRNGKGMLYDLVLECERREDCDGKRLIRFSGNSQTDKSLLAMGTALSKAVRRMNPDVLPELYQSELEKFDIKESCIR